MFAPNTTILSSDFPNLIDYYREVKTISLNFGRQTGKTTELCNKYKHKNSLIVCNNDSIQGDIIQRLSLKHPDIKNFNVLVFDINFLINLKNLNKKYKLILIDEASDLFEKTNRVHFYRSLERYIKQDPLIICLG